jgi:hypothetical protein
MDGASNKGGAEGLKSSYSGAVKGLKPWEVDVPSPEEKQAFLDAHYKSEDQKDGDELLREVANADGESLQPDLAIKEQQENYEMNEKVWGAVSTMIPTSIVQLAGQQKDKSRW